MSLQGSPSPLIAQGWLRAIVLLVIYLAFSIGAGYLLPSMELWITCSFVISSALVYVFRKFIDKKSFQSLGLTSSDLLRHALMGLSLGMFLISTGSLIIYLLNSIQWVDVAPELQDLMVGAALLLMVAVSEELVFRGYVLKNLMKSFNNGLALFISAVLFTAVHLSNPGIPLVGIINTFLGGLLTGLTYMYMRNLWLPVFFHFTWNFMQGPVLGYEVSGLPFGSMLIMENKTDDLLNGGDYGFEGSLICTLLLVLAVAAFGYAEARRRMHVKQAEH